VRALLAAERSALNIASRASGIATLTPPWVDAVEGTGAVVLDTRKTTPGCGRWRSTPSAAAAGRTSAWASTTSHGQGQPRRRRGLGGRRRRRVRSGPPG
jgi:hypothetical protein